MFELIFAVDFKFETRVNYFINYYQLERNLLDNIAYYFKKIIRLIYRHINYYEVKLKLIRRLILLVFNFLFFN